jgi:hypothetical protein
MISISYFLSLLEGKNIFEGRTKKFAAFTMLLFIFVLDDNWADGSYFAGDVFSFEFKVACVSKILLHFLSQVNFIKKHV